MTEPNLRVLLEKLHEELQRTEATDEKGRELLRGVDVEIRAFLERSGEAGNEPVLDKLQSAMDHFEITHPNLTMAISEIMTVLSNAGI